MKLGRILNLARKYAAMAMLDVAAIGLIVLGLYPGLLKHQPSQPVAFASPDPYKAENAATDPSQPLAISGKPIRILLPELNIGLSVIDGDYTPASQTWTLSEDKAQFAVVTALANNLSGNTFIYGHNNWSVFAALPKVQPGQEAVIETDNNLRFYYTFKASAEVAPTDTGLFRYTGSPILTLQTCSGRWYEKRHLFIFDFERYEPII